MHGFAGGKRGAGGSAGNVGRRVHADGGAAKKIHGGFGEDDFHDGFAVAGAGSAAGLRVGKAAAADQRRIANASGKLAAGAASGGGGEAASVGISGRGANGSLLVAAVMLGGVFVGLALHPGFLLGFADQFLGLAWLEALFCWERFGAFGDQPHVRATLQDSARELNGILDAVQIGRRAGAQRGAVHDDGVTFDVPVEIEVRAVAGVEDGIVFEDHNGGFDGVESGAASRKDGPAHGKSAAAARFANVNGFVRNVPRAAVNNQRWFHQQSIAEKKENANPKNETRNTKPENRLGERKNILTQRTRSSQRAQRRRKYQTKRSSTKRRKPRKRRIAGPLMRRRGKQAMERTKVTGMALKRDSSRRA